jgi:L-asparagine oxygenase
MMRFLSERQAGKGCVDIKHQDKCDVGQVPFNLDQLQGDGYSFTRKISQPRLAELIQHLGPIRVDPRNPDQIRDIRPQATEEANSNTLSSRYGTEEFPFHTDCAHWHKPARYLVLYCVCPGSGDRPTLLKDSHTWKLNDAEEDLTCRALWRTGHVRPQICTVANRTDGRLAVRYDRDCMRPMTAEARELSSLLELRLERSPVRQIEWEPECLLVVDNHRLVHARGKSNKADGDRWLKRILLGE